jgi:peptidoglycan-associated lipoprotein
MNTTKLTALLLVTLALTLAGTGCRKKPVGPIPINKSTTVVRPGTAEDLPPIENGDPGMIGTPMTPEEWVTNPDAHTEDTAALAANVVHFDFDSSVVKSSESANVDAVASFLKSNADAAVRIDGHCDERGTEGYNDALGERRASALRESLIALGANPNLVVTRSLGESKPVNPANNDSAWAENRRAEFIVLRRK